MTRLVLFRACLAAALVMLPACGGDDDNGPSTPADYTGTWVGDYTVSLQPGTTYQGTLTVTQSGNEVSGSLTTTAGRQADFVGTVSGNRLTGSFTYTDGCTGSATVSATISADGRTVTGTFRSNDCLGTYTGAFTLSEQ